jgi:dihydrofolate reductase
VRKLAIVEFLTLDGVMQGFGGPDEDRSGGFVHGGWGAPYADEVLAREAGSGIGETSAYLFGRKTYEHMAARWPHEPDGNPIAASLNARPKHVVTRTLTRLDWSGSHFLAGDLEAGVRGLKAEGEGFITVLGSGQLARALMARDLVDVYRVMLHPLVLGTGTRLFGETPGPLPLRLVDCTPTTTGVLLLNYERASTAVGP